MDIGNIGSSGFVLGGAKLTSTRAWRKNMFAYTGYFENDVLVKRPYIKKEWCERIVSSWEHREEQPDGRVRFWGRIPEYGNRYLRVVTLPDQRTILNAFFDRNFK